MTAGVAIDNSNSNSEGVSQSSLRRSIDSAYQAAAALDYLLGAACDASVPASHMRTLLRPLLMTLDTATEG